jgi:enterochelin esterase-like enzyme
MRTVGWHFPRFAVQLSRWFALWLVLAGLVFSQTEPVARHGSVEHIKVHGKSLEGNLEGDSADRDVSVYLPPSYAIDSGRRYPVLYLLHGFTDTDAVWFGDKHTFVNGTAAADRAFTNGTREMILVMPNAFTRYFGSLYSNSATIGDWEDFIAHDLVAYIDGHYRTIADRMSRGLAGHSMGGYGTFRLGMKHAQVFSSIYAMSACCLAPSHDLQTSVKANLEDIHTDEELARADFFAKANFASAAAWSPDPDNPPRFLDLPWRNGDFQPLIAEKWAANASTIMIDQYVPSLKALHAIALDVGTKDFLVAGVQAMDTTLTAYKIAHTYETYDGNHTNRIEVRFEKQVLPFFAANLSFQPVSGPEK